MQLFGYGNNIFYARKILIQQVLFIFETKHYHHLRITISLFFSQTGSSIYSRLTLNNAWTCTSVTCNGKINFLASSLGTTYTGWRIFLWPGTGLSTSTDWYGLGMNSYTMIYNGPTGAKHSFQINGT